MINKKALALLFLATSKLVFTSYDPETNPKDTTLYCQTDRRDATTPQTTEPSIIVLNYAQRATAEESFQSFRYHKLSTHYIIDKDGKIYKGISEQLEEIPTKNGIPTIDAEYIKLRAFHTGVGYWNGDQQEIHNINTHSIGILFVNEANTHCDNPDFLIGNPENATKWFEYTPEQLQSFVTLTHALKNRYNIANKDIVGYHEVRSNNDILNAGGGPGPLFDWKSAAEHGVGLYHNLTEEELTNAPEPSIKDLQTDLHAWGYKVEITGELNKQTEQAMKQCIIHHDPYQFPPTNIARTSLILKALLAQYYAEKHSNS